MASSPPGKRGLRVTQEEPGIRVTSRHDEYTPANAILAVLGGRYGDLALMLRQAATRDLYVLRRDVVKLAELITDEQERRLGPPLGDAATEGAEDERDV